ncbi:DUF4595 domain-containing protein [Bacteroides bouchesdurhonensis]|uniref:DUF4595 domain-containing protein n=1 Tax=Bacteroides bouchesdurhonensis TaxID=1841855 RepID=UPI0011DDDAED|nr:DUF4595 domain-containing protein [Bacteroides bouchesdurhonensis]
MKTFRLIGMALLAVVMCVNFASCSDDDEEPIKNDDGVITNQKQLMQIKMVDDSDVITWDFTYDSKSRLISINHAESYDDGETYRDITNFTWSNNTIVAEDDDVISTYSLNDNLVRTIRQTRDNSWERKRTFAYNSSNQVVNIQTTEESYTDTDSYTWDNDRIVKLTSTEKGSYHNDEYVYEYTYNGKTCKGYFPLYSPYDSDDIFYVHPELIGLRCSQLPDQVYSKDKYYENIDKFTYTFDKDGYVESCTVVGTYKNLSDNTTDTETTIFTFTWE